MEARHDCYQSGYSIRESNRQVSVTGSTKGRGGLGEGRAGLGGGVRGKFEPLGSTGCDWRVFKSGSNGQHRNMLVSL